MHLSLDKWDFIDIVLTQSKFFNTMIYVHSNAHFKMDNILSKKRRLII